MGLSMALLQNWLHLAAAVSNQLWFKPERAATCSMCLKVYITEGDRKKCPKGDWQSNAACPGVGTQSYAKGVTQPWAYSAKLQRDQAKGMDYFIGVVIEWFDRWVL